jgi:CheY-like chemotaxis protein
MTDEVMAQAMEPFFTTSPDGTGLGLTSVYRIAQQAGGYVEMTSALGEGTSVSVTFPTTDIAPGHPDRERETPTEGTSTILLVEDDDDVRPLIARALTRLGYGVIVTASGEEALAAARDPKVDIDLVLTDVLMPGMTGGEVVDRLKRSRPDLKGLFMSGYAADELARRGITDADVYVQKPFQVHALAERIASALDS